MREKRKKGTATSSFGLAGRNNHHSETFYAGKMYQGLTDQPTASYVENPLAPEDLNRIFCRSSACMDNLGYEISGDYCELARRRIGDFMAGQNG